MSILFFQREEPISPKLIKSKMRITIKESTMIRPALDLPNEHLWLSNVDLLYERTFISTVYLFKSIDSSSNSFETKSLKDAMSKVLVPFYPMAGRVGRDDNGRIVINCNNEGVLFIEAETDSAIDDLGDFMRNVEIMKLMPTLDASNHVSYVPPFISQVTTFTCGGVSIGIRFHHLFSDGHGALHFANTWFDVARGLPISISPLFDRTVLCSREPPKPKFKHVEYHKPPTMNTNTSIQNPNNSQSNNCIEIFKITPHQLNTLKAKDIKYSSYKILLAHIWRCTTKARGLANDQKTRLNVAVNGRSRLHPPIKHGYLGNAIFYATPIASSSEILSETLNETVKRIDEEIKKVDDEYLRSSLDYLHVLDDLTPVMRGPTSSQCPNLNITDWVKMPFYEADFGMGKPVYVTPAYPPEGIGYILQNPPSHDDGGRAALIICLKEDHMQSFKKLFYTLEGKRFMAEEKMVAISEDVVAESHLRP